MSAFVSGIENLIKAVLPQPVVQGIRAYRHAANIRRYEASVRRRALREWRLMLSNWRKEARAMQARGGAARAHGRILVFPSDPGAVVGSRGDDAMITTVLEATRPPSSGVVVDMFCDAGGDKVVKSMGFNPIPFPSQGDFPAALAGLLRERSYDQYIGVGADIIDGRFGVRIPASMLIAADLAARAGIPATILGSSFSEAPMPQLAAVFRQLDARVHLNIRDPISLRRVVAFAPVQPRLVADAAFLLKPGRADAATVEWIQRQRTMGRRVIGVNAHPMLVPNADASWSGRMAASLAHALSEVAARHSISWLLLPHDYRDDFGDVACLRLVHELLQGGAGSESRLLDHPQSAADLKALVGCVDAVITGRMHLAIAALGMAVPPLGLTYHDKFEGLYSHFELPQSLLLPPSIFDSPSELARRIEAFIDAIPLLVDVIERSRPKVVGLARQNFVH